MIRKGGSTGSAAFYLLLKSSGAGDIATSRDVNFVAPK
jgi:hypothetical protein